MNEIKCPHCGKAFKIDEAGYADILKQVRDGEFEQQLHGERTTAGPDLEQVAIGERGENLPALARQTARKHRTEFRRRDKVAGRTELVLAGTVVTELRRVERELHEARERNRAAGTGDLRANQLGQALAECVFLGRRFRQRWCGRGSGHGSFDRLRTGLGG